ncbi:RNA polymerase sigma factor [Rhodopila sp.]|uniref:RNA polymerase sigma factor n=1 Tax=Rhodopila sp. TaxID=2480087 RepID=UPI003D0E8F54
MTQRRISAALSLIGSQTQAEEAVQDAWLAVFGGIGRFKNRSSVVTWIFSIVRNAPAAARGISGVLLACLPSVTAAKRGRRAGEGHSAFGVQAGRPLEAEPCVWDSISAERIVAGRQLWDHVHEIIERLPHARRAVLVLGDMEGQTAEEACKLLKILSENQRVLLHRARSRCARRWTC